MNPGCLVLLKGGNKTLQSVLRVFNYSQNAFIKTGAAAASGTGSILSFSWNWKQRHYVFSLSLFFFYPTPNPSVPQGSLRPHSLGTCERTPLRARVSRRALADILRCIAESVFNLSTFFFKLHFRKKSHDLVFECCIRCFLTVTRRRRKKKNNKKTPHYKWH